MFIFAANVHFCSKYAASEFHLCLIIIRTGRVLFYSVNGKKMSDSHDSRKRTIKDDLPESNSASKVPKTDLQNKSICSLDDQHEYSATKSDEKSLVSSVSSSKEIHFDEKKGSDSVVKAGYNEQSKEIASDGKKIYLNNLLKCANNKIASTASNIKEDNSFSADQHDSSTNKSPVSGVSQDDKNVLTLTKSDGKVKLFTNLLQINNC